MLYLLILLVEDRILNIYFAFLTTIFPMKKQYLLDFFGSLTRQTFDEFDVVVVNDGYRNFDEITTLFKTLKIVELPFSDSPAKNREHGINYVLKNKYQYVVFGDSDDYFAENRVYKSIDLLKQYDIVVNDLTLFDETGLLQENYISNRVNNLTVIDINFIKDKNIFGLSNTAVNTKILQGISFDKGLIAVDWYLFSVLLLQSKQAVFSNETRTFYRQYSGNSAGMGFISEQTINRAIDIKMKHYETLRSFDVGYKSLYEEICILKNKVTKSFSIEKLLNKNIDTPLWWEETKLLAE